MVHERLNHAGDLLSACGRFNLFHIVYLMGNRCAASPQTQRPISLTRGQVRLLKPDVLHTDTHTPHTLLHSFLFCALEAF